MSNIIIIFYYCSLSLAGKDFPLANAAVKALIDLDIHVTVAAGNYFGENLCYSSPASSPEVISTDATNIDDLIPIFSNSGPCVDLFAPGYNITSTWFGINGIKTMSGTSMASPHVAGVIALIIGQRGNMTPAKNEGIT
ncbi:hypothetical protein RclHR1_04020020 [Rhizophagus clarus]|uniref:Peptidase S8/S53 domain-containing protein n=1 Tax=Rhizophagus clarus TaxID=94130 RepID=A0A2Z6RFZ5_9GLOM|nr:hypothetical protein RclHR1_04020020 [Rhizophagus clarus]